MSEKKVISFALSRGPVVRRTGRTSQDILLVVMKIVTVENDGRVLRYVNSLVRKVLGVVRRSPTRMARACAPPRIDVRLKIEGLIWIDTPP